MQSLEVGLLSFSIFFRFLLQFLLNKKNCFLTVCQYFCLHKWYESDQNSKSLCRQQVNIQSPINCRSLNFSQIFFSWQSNFVMSTISNCATVLLLNDHNLILFVQICLWRLCQRSSQKLCKGFWYFLGLTKDQGNILREMTAVWFSVNRPEWCVMPHWNWSICDWKNDW